jgi:hypothetical protein
MCLILCMIIYEIPESKVDMRNDSLHEELSSSANRCGGESREHCKQPLNTEET